MFTRDVNRLFVVSFFVALLFVAYSLSFIKFAHAAMQQQTTGTATVVSAGLNVRSGPGTSYGRIGTVKSSESLNVIGQYNNCAWLKISTATIAEGWVSGASRFVKLNVACATIPAATGSTSAATGSVPQSAPVQPTVAPTPLPIATSQPAPAPAPASDPSAWLAPGVDPGMAAELEQKVPLKDNEACILFQNFISRPIYITLTQQDGSHIKEISLERNEERVECLLGGRYSVTITSANLGSTGGEIKFYVGKRDVFRVFLNR